MIFQAAEEETRRHVDIVELVARRLNALLVDPTLTTQRRFTFPPKPPAKHDRRKHPNELRCDERRRPRRRDASERVG
jgi:hypothetical protein